MAVPLEILIQNATAGDLTASLKGPDLVAVAALALNTALGLVSPAIGGILADRFGVRSVVTALLLALCVIAVAALGLPSPMVRGVVALATACLPGALLVCILTGLRLALAKRRRGPALAACLLLFTFAAPIAREVWRFVTETARGAWAVPTVAWGLAAACALVTLLWILLIPKDDLETASALERSCPEVRVRVLRCAELWRVLPIVVCAGIVQTFGMGGFNVSPGLLITGRTDVIDLLLVVVVPVAFLISAAWSDRTLKRLVPRAPRRPFIVLGFVAAGIAPLLAKTVPGEATPLLAIGAVGLGATYLAALLPVDVAPRVAAGRFIGATLALAVVARAVIEITVLIAGGASRPLVVCSFALLGAALSAWTLGGAMLADDQLELRRPAEAV